MGLKFMKRRLSAFVLSGCLVLSSGCGVLLYPERQGQSDGKIDPVVALLDGMGLLLYVIPGLVAFAVDFHQGTIYLPGDGLSDAEDVNLDDARQVKIEGPVDQESVEKAILEATGKTVDLGARNVQVINLQENTSQVQIARLRSSTSEI